MRRGHHRESVCPKGYCVRDRPSHPRLANSSPRGRGSSSKKSEKFLDTLSTRAEIVIAEMHNEAALAGASEKEKSSV